MLDTPRTVREVTDRIRDLFDSDPVLADIWITGEVLESTVSRSGHVFFTLAGDGAQLRSVMFRMNALRQRSLPSSGSVCTAHGKIEVYPTDGSYQFYVDLAEEAGIGLAALELELLRQQLEAEGLFADSRKRSLPAQPATIGVITSPAGAVWHDIQTILRRRYPFARLLLSPAAVQGEGAPADLVAALESLLASEVPDVIVIARGGGSASDLAAFNDERLVRAAFAAPVPVVSAIGHETDWSLLDLVADVRAPTPSAAAEIVARPVERELIALDEALAAHLRRFERDIAVRFVDLDRARTRFDQRALIERKERVNLARRALVRSALATQQRASDQASQVAALLEALSPAKTMGRGYAFVERAASGQPIAFAADVELGESLRTRFLDGNVESLVTKTQRSES